jgi:hypothetical protein
VDAEALCLSSSEGDSFAPQYPNKSCSDEDRHKAPTLPLIHPLSLQNREYTITDFDW